MARESDLPRAGIISGLEGLTPEQWTDFYWYLDLRGLSFPSAAEPIAETDKKTGEIAMLGRLMLFPTLEGEFPDFAVSFADIVRHAGAEGSLTTRAYNCLGQNAGPGQAIPQPGSEGRKLFSYKWLAEAVTRPVNPDLTHTRTLIDKFKHGGDKTTGLIKGAVFQKSHEIEKITRQHRLYMFNP